MASSSPGREICPYCKKTFKRLKSHLPHCKMAGSPDSSEVLSPTVKVCSSVMPELLTAEKEKGKTGSTETASKKEKKRKPDLTRNRTTKSLELKIAGTAPNSNLHEDGDTQAQIKHVTEKTHKTKGSRQRASGEVCAQPAEKAVLEMTRAKKSSSVRKSRSEMTSEEKEFMPCLALEPPVQNRKPTSESASQTESFAKHRPSKEDFGKQNESSWPDSSAEDQHITDSIDLVIENHRVRVLRNMPGSSVQSNPLHRASINNYKISQWPIKPSPGSEKTDSTSGQQVVPVTQSKGGESALGLELAQNVSSAEIGDGIKTVKIIASVDCNRGNCRKFPDIPLQLAAAKKSIIDKDPLFLKRKEEYPKGSHVSTTFKSEIYAVFAEALREKDDEISNYSLTSLGKDTSLLSETIVTPIYKASEIPLRPPSVDMLERTSVEPSSLGLEFFPELYPNYVSLGLLSKRLPQWNVRIPGAQVLIFPSEGKHVLTERCLMDVKLQDLPAWLATRNLSPQGMLNVTCRAWNGYYNRYINVRKGGVAGVAMLLLGYCILSYAWSYEHIKQSRWRKYH